ncbi:MAG: peptidoglycan-binding protein [Candidatus Sungbacteria bacterium]|uniref:Peptidoglycan-binding protein n=1 Tax=Candidatus Sungiibacteriota bacterium TaxID=2750080 RepID=A0A931WN21_9BACT|nr:peptidoglycan-binding protein [Candidatus Sungbacteria bacterium]
MKKVLSFVLLSVFVLPLAALAAADELTSDLTLGSRGESVSLLQSFLAKDAALYPEGIVSGYFGRLTQSAVKRFQQREGITPAAGYVGPKTRAKINSRLLRVSPESELEALLNKLAELQKTLAEKEREISGTTTPATSTPPLVIEPAATTTPPRVPTNTLYISGSETRRFAESTKLGDVTFANDSASAIVLYRVNITMDEAMNAPNSRGRDMKLLLRNGTTTYSDLLVRQDITIRSRVPDPGPYNTQLISYYAGQTLAPGESKTLSLWAELLVGPFYGGVLKFTVDSATSNPELPSAGSAAFTLSEP